MVKPAPPKKSKASDKRLLDLSPTEFENLTFDLLLDRGMKNVSWRTPGADGGRDIEGQIHTLDFAGTTSSEKWYVECKRYTSSVDWPTIYAKIAYADAQGADVLLLVISSKFTPNAISNVSSWNNSKRSLRIRLWPSHDLLQILKHTPDLELKYGLNDAPKVPGKSLLNLTLAMAKAIQSHHSKLIFNDIDVDPMLEAAQSLALLLLRRTEDLKEAHQIVPSYENLISSVKSSVDEFGLLAIADYVSAISNSTYKSTMTNSYECDIVFSSPVDHFCLRYNKIFDAIAIWSDFEYTIFGNKITLRQRR